MAQDNDHRSNNGQKAKPSADEEQHGVDFSRYRMNPVQGEESQQTAQGSSRRVVVLVPLLLVIAVAVIGILWWSRFAAEQSPLESLDPEVRARARELIDKALPGIESLQGYVYDAKYVSATKLRIFINPTFVVESGVERPVTDGEIERATERVVQEFRGYGPEHRALTVEAFVVEYPSHAAEQSAVAVGTYDPETDSLSVRLTPRIPVPQARGTGEALPPKGHGGEGRGVGMPAPPPH